MPKSIIKTIIVFILLLGSLIFFGQSAEAALNCRVTAGALNPGEIVVFRMSNTTNAHFDRWDGGYAQKVVCGGTGLNLERSCSPLSNKLMDVSSSYNAHVGSVGSYSSYTCLSDDNYTVNTSLTNNANCPVDYVTLASMSSITNAHIGDPGAYVNKICAKVNIVEDIFVKAKLDGIAWSGAIAYSITGKANLSGSAVPTTHANQSEGNYTITYNSGGPVGVAPNSITPATSQTIDGSGAITFTFNFSSPAPEADIKANDSDSPSIASGTKATLEWCGSNAHSCASATSCKVGTTSGGNDISNSAVSGSYLTPALFSDTTYYLGCTGPGGTSSDTVVITVTSASDFNVTATSPLKSPQTGSSNSSTVTVSSLNGFNNAVALSVRRCSSAADTTCSQGAASGITPSLASNSLTPPANNSIDTNLSFTTAGAAAGTYYYRVRGVSGATRDSGVVTLNVVNLGVDLTAPGGAAPLNTTLTATVNGSETGTINYTFWWNCNNASNSVVVVTAACGDPNNSSNGAKFDGQGATSKAVDHTYAADGTYTAKVIVERGIANPAEDRTDVVVSSSVPLDVSCVANPNPVHNGVNTTFTATGSGGTAPYTYTWSGVVSGAGATKTYSNNTSGNYTANVEVKDNTNATDTNSCDVDITNNNPTVNAGSDVTVNEYTFLDMAARPTPASASDPDGDSLTYSWSCNPTGIFAHGSNVLNPSGTSPYVTSNTSYDCDLTVSDSFGGSATDRATITVNDTIARLGVSVSCLGTGNGKVNTNPPNSDTGCGSNVYDYNKGTSVTLTATNLNPSGQFNGWGIDCGGVAATCDLTMNGDRNASAQFQGPDFTASFQVRNNILVEPTNSLSRNYLSRFRVDSHQFGFNGPVNFISGTVNECSASNANLVTCSTEGAVVPGGAGYSNGFLPNPVPNAWPGGVNTTISTLSGNANWDNYLKSNRGDIFAHKVTAVGGPRTRIIPEDRLGNNDKSAFAVNRVPLPVFNINYPGSGSSVSIWENGTTDPDSIITVFTPGKTPSIFAAKFEYVAGWLPDPDPLADPDDKFDQCYSPYADGKPGPADIQEVIDYLNSICNNLTPDAPTAGTPWTYNYSAPGSYDIAYVAADDLLGIGATVNSVNVVNNPPIAVAGISSEGLFDPVAPVFMTKVDNIPLGEDIDLYFAAHNNIPLISDDSDGWNDPYFGISNGGKCEWDSTDFQGAGFTPGAFRNNPSNFTECSDPENDVINYITITENFAIPGTHTYPVLKITDGQGLSSIATVDLEVKPKLTLEKEGNGKGNVVTNVVGNYPPGISCDVNCDAIHGVPPVVSTLYSVGTAVTLTATPAAGAVPSTFAGWGESGGVSDCDAEYTVLDVSGNILYKCDVAMNNNRTVRAKFISPTLAIEPANLLNLRREQTYQYRALFDPDGPNGPLSPYEVTHCTDDDVANGTNPDSPANPCLSRIEWSVINESVAGVADLDYGFVTAKTRGVATISAKFYDFNGDGNLDIEADPKGRVRVIKYKWEEV